MIIRQVPVSRVVHWKASSSATTPMRLSTRMPDGGRLRVSPAPPDAQRPQPRLRRLHQNTRQYPAQFSADAGYRSEANLAALTGTTVYAVIALRHYHQDEPVALTLPQDGHNPLTPPQ